MRRVPIVLIVAFALAAALGLTAPGRAAAEGAETFKYYDTAEVTPTIGYLCFGEFVAFSGTVTVAEHVTYDAAGGVHVAGLYARIWLRGVGLTTGTRYVSTAAEYEFSRSSYGTLAEQTIVTLWRTISQGPGDNQRSTLIAHFTRTPDGQLAVSFRHVTSECP